MIIIIICVIIGIIIGLCGSDPVVQWISGAVGGIILGFFLALFIGAVAYTGVEWRPVSSTPLVSLADGAGIEGRFSFLGSGFIGDAQEFTWYEKSGDNAFVRKSVDAGSATVHYLQSGRKPYYTYNETVPTPKGFIQPWGLQVARVGEDYSYDFYIPKGSIVQDYTLDNK